MESYSQKELNEAVELIASTIRNCEKMKLKFEEGTSQNTLINKTPTRHFRAQIVG